MTEFPPIRVGHRPEEGSVITDMGYPIYGEGLYRALKRFHKLGIPIIITENGLADSKDTIRDLGIKRYIYALAKAIDEGIDCRGYFFWSLMDNFEWADGYSMRFGLHHVNYTNQVRTLRNGSKFFVDVVAAYNRLEN